MRIREAIDEAKDALGFSDKSPNEADQNVAPELRHLYRALSQIRVVRDDEYESQSLAEGALAQCRRAREYLACFHGSWELDALLIDLERFLVRRANGLPEEGVPKRAAS